MEHQYFIDESRSLEHYGVMGMKWGVRKDRTLENRKGVVTDRKLSKVMKKSWNPKGNWTNRNAVNAKVNAETLKTKEGKAYQKLMKERGRIRTSTGERYLSYYDKKRSTEELLDQMIKDQAVKDAYNKKNREIAQAHIDEYSGALLKDLNYKDTEVGRAAVKKAMGY